MSSKNGDGPHDNPLGPIRARIEERLAEVEAELEPRTGTVPRTITPSDPLSDWKHKGPGNTVTLDEVHTGLIVTSEYAEAAIESGIQNTVALRASVAAANVRNELISGIAAKVEATQVMVHQVDQELANHNKTLDEVRRDVQFLKDDVRVVLPAVESMMGDLRAIKSMLGDILVRLPEKPAA
jgi:chromosome segregation ATPase